MGLVTGGMEWAFGFRGKHGHMCRLGPGYGMRPSFRVGLSGQDGYWTSEGVRGKSHTQEASCLEYYPLNIQIFSANKLRRPFEIL